MEYVILFLLGVALGSFVNVLVLRYSPDKRFSWRAIQGRSRCDHCAAQLRWYELIPLVSFIVQKRKCRSCKQALLWQYPIVELGMGIIAIGVGSIFLHAYPYFFGLPIIASYGAIAFWLVVSVVLVYAFLIDLRYHIIPNGTNLFLCIAGIVWTVVLMMLYTDHQIGTGSFLGPYAQLWQWDSILVNHVLGMLIAGLFFALVVIVTRGKGMGMGDVKLIMALGLLFGWPDIALIVLCSFVLGTIAVLPLLITRKKKGKDAVPFGPFIVLASFVIMFWGAGLLQSYFGIIGTLGGSI